MTWKPLQAPSFSIFLFWHWKAHPRISLLVFTAEKWCVLMHRNTSLFCTNWFWISNYPIRVGTWKSHISYVSAWKSCWKKRTPHSPLTNVKCDVRFKFLESDPESLVFCWGTIRWSRCCCNFFSPNMTSDCTSRVVPATQDNFKSICRPTTVICKNYSWVSRVFHWTILKVNNLENIRII